MKQYKYEKALHGNQKYPVAIYSEDTYGAQAHYHKEYEIYYLSKGSITLGIDGYERKITAGEVVFIDPYTEHSYFKTGEDFHYYALLFDSNILGGDDDPAKLSFESVRFNRYISLSEEILSRIPALLKADREHIFGNEILMKLFIFSIINHLIATNQYSIISGMNHQSGERSKAVSLATDYINLHYKEQIKIEDILGLVKYSQSHFMRVFKAETGYTLTNYINHVRIEKACLELLYSSKSLTEVAIGNGFSTPQYFSKIFAEIMSQTPKQFRNHAKGLIAPPIDL